VGKGGGYERKINRYDEQGNDENLLVRREVKSATNENFTIEYTW